MNNEYTTVSTTANIIQSVTDALRALNPENIEIPTETQEITNDIQACIARVLRGTK